MKNKYFPSPPSGRGSIRLAFALTWTLFLAGQCLVNGATVTTLGGGNPNVNPKYLGYSDGITLSQALFRTPAGLALDSTGHYLFVADRDNNAIRYLDLIAGRTWSLGVPDTNIFNKPIAVAVDADDYVYVLNRGSGTNGSVITLDYYSEPVMTNAIRLTNAAGMAMDGVGNIYISVQSNKLVRIAAGTTNQTTVATITNAGTSLQGLIVKHNGLIAACDAGNNGIWLINPATTNAYVQLAGFHGAGDFNTNSSDTASPTTAKFNKPMCVAEAGDGTLIVTDNGNNRVKVVFSNGSMTNLYGVTSQYWGGTYPGWYDGVGKIPDSVAPNAQSRLPFGIVFGPDGTIYTSEDYYHLIRKVTATGLPLPPPPPPQVPTPQIGWVEFPASANPAYSSVFHAVSSFVFNNDAPIIIQGTAGSQTYYTYANTPNLGTVPDPTAASVSAALGYQDGLTPQEVNALAVAGIAPYVAIKAIGEKNDGSPNSAIAQALFQFITANPNIGGNNAAQFTVSDITYGATLFFTTDGSDPKISPTAIARGFIPSTNIIINTAAFNFSSNNFLFKCFARKANYQDSGVVSNYFSANGFIPNRITFGLTNGEPSSTFVARPGQVFYAPVTLQLQPGGETMFSLQFNISVTNGLTTPNKIVNGAGIGFSPMLMSQVPAIEGYYYPPAAGQWFLTIPCLTPFVSSGSTNLSDTIFVNTNNNLLGVGWLYRTGYRYQFADTNGIVFLDFNTAQQDLISYSIAHDTLFSKSGGTVIAGAYSFSVPEQAGIGDQYFIQLGSPSGTRDGVGAPGADVYIQAPVNNQAVTVGSPAYVVGDAAPFRWLNAGDFGEGMLNNADVMQAFQCAIEGVDMPPANSDLFAALDSSGVLGSWDGVNQYYTKTATAVSAQALFDGNDLTINTNAFGDGSLDVSDVYVTFRRSLDPSLVWLKRYWTNSQFVAVPVPNLAYNSNTPHLKLARNLSKNEGDASYAQSSVTFSAGDAINGAGQTVQIPITANVFGSYPLRVLGLNLTVHPLDGSPEITSPVQFTPAAGLGQPTIAASKFAANYCAAWLNSTVSGLTSNATIGTLTVTLPTNATGSSAYAVHFDHASASPNGLGSFPEQKLTGLITLTSRTNSSYNDGIPDAWRLRWFGTIYNSLSVSNADACGDGISNYKKFIAGTDPTVAGAYPQLAAKNPATAGATTIHWPTVSGKKYAIERSTSLFPGAWSTLTTNTGTGTDMEFNDSSTGSVKFYRVRILP